MIAARRIDVVALGAAFAALIAGAWLLPYRFPRTTFIAGASYQVGFNNTVSYLWYLAFLLVPALILARSLGPRMVTAPAAPGIRMVWRPSRSFGLVAIGHVVMFAAVYAYKGRFVFAESLYFQSLVYRMTFGEAPYRDFSFYYGPTMLYPAYWLTKLVPVEPAYGVWFVTTYVAGLYLLHVLLRSLLGPTRVASLWFVLLGVGLINPWTGLNVTFLRYMLPSTILFATAAFITSGGGPRFLVAAFLLAFAIPYTFEVAALSLLAALAALTASVFMREIVAALRRIRRVVGLAHDRDAVAGVGEPPGPSRGVALGRGLAVLVVGAGLGVACFFAIDPSGAALWGYPEVALSYSSGAHNMPISPNLPFLTLAAISVVCLALLSRMTVGGGAPALAALAATYMALALVTQRGAFGVSEPTHIAFYGLPALFIALMVSARLVAHRPLMRALGMAVIVGVVLPIQYFHATQLLPFLTHVRGVPPAGAATAAAGSRLEGRSVEGVLAEVVKAVGTDRPYVMYELDYYSFPVYRKFGLRFPAYETMMITARTDAGMTRMIAEVRRSRAIVVARAADLSKAPEIPRSQGVWEALDLISGAHTTGSGLNALLLENRRRLFARFLDFVRAEYRPLYERDGIVALGPKAG